MNPNTPNNITYTNHVEQINNAEDDHIRPNSASPYEFQDAIQFLEKVQAVFSDQKNIYNDFLGIMKVRVNYIPILHNLRVFLN